MLASPSRCRPMFSRQQSHRTTRRTPDTSSTGFQPVSSHSGQVILVEMTAETFGVTLRAAGAQLDIVEGLVEVGALVERLCEAFIDRVDDFGDIAAVGDVGCLMRQRQRDRSRR